MALRTGKRAPNFALKNQFDKTIWLNDFLGKNVVLAFFPLAWTPI
jgi:peroxiredoxin